MRVVLDTNVLISALIQPAGRAAGIYDAWNEDKYDLLFCEELIDEIRRLSRSTKLRHIIPSFEAGRLVNDIRNYGIEVETIPDLDVSPDPWDNFLLALAEAGSADFLVSGDKADLLSLGRHGATKIISVRTFAEQLGF